MAAARPPDLARRAAGRLTPVERVLLLRASPLFEKSDGRPVARAGGGRHEVPLIAGAAFSADTGDPAIHIVMAGTLILEAPGHDASPCARAGDTVGAYETLTGSPTGERVTVATPGSALRLDRGVLFELPGRPRRPPAGDHQHPAATRAGCWQTYS